MLVALSVADDKAAIDKLIRRQKLDKLHVAIGTDWLSKFALPDVIPTTVLLDDGRIRVVHDGVLLDPVAMLDADLSAVRTGTNTTKVN